MSRKKKYVDRELLEGKTWQTIIYPDSTTYDYNHILDKLQWICETYYYIVHDRDIYTEYEYEIYKKDNDRDPDFKIGDLKKKHIHIVIRKSCNCTLGMASKQLEVPSFMVERCKSFKASIQYLIHKNNKDKIQYNIDEIITNDDNLGNLMMNNTATEKARILIDFIYCSDCESLYSLTQFAIKNECWDELRRGQHIYQNLFREAKENELQNYRNQKG